LQELLEEAIVGAMRNPTLSGLVNLWGTTILAALSSCAVMKVLTLAGYLAVIKISDWRRLLSGVFMYVLGMGFSYLFVMIIIIKAPFWINILVIGSSVLYSIVGIVLVVFGIIYLGFIKAPLSRIKLLSKSDPDHDYLAAFLLGAFVVLMESLSCPICNPILKLFSAIYVKQGIFRASIVFVVFFLGQSTLPLISGLILAPLKQLLAKRDGFEYIQIAGAIILVLIGLNLLWLS